MGDDRISSGTKTTLKLSLILIILCIMLVFIFSLCILPDFIKKTAFREDDGQDRNYHVLVLGQADNQAFLSQVWQGAKSMGERYGAVVELYAPTSQAEDVSLQGLLDYASYVNADGILLYMTSLPEKLSLPKRTDGFDIPIISMGHFYPEFPSASFIGSNYSELGRRIGFEASVLLDKDDGTIWIVSSGNKSSTNYGNLMNSLVGYFRRNSVSSFSFFDRSGDDEETEIASIIAGKKGGSPVFVCLTEEDTIFVSQCITRLTGSRKIPVIGFGENETALMYLEKGIVTKLVTVDPEKIGETAMTELFEFRTKGYANSYISADIRVRSSK